MLTKFLSRLKEKVCMFFIDVIAFRQLSLSGEKIYTGLGDCGYGWGYV